MASNQGKGAIFDLDGTLLDSMGVWDQVDIDFLSKRGIDVPDDYMTKVAAMQFRQIAEYTIARFDLSDTPEELMDEWDHMALRHVFHSGRSQAICARISRSIEGERSETCRCYIAAADDERAGDEACWYFRLLR